MKRKAQENGLTVIGTLVYVTIIGACYLSYLFVPVLIDYYEIKEVLLKTANSSYTVRDEQKLIRDCAEWVRRKEIVTSEICRIERRDGGKIVAVSMVYRPMVNFWPTKEIRKYEFDITATQDMTYEMRH